MEERASAATVGPGTVLNATYRIERRLGEGGMGVVWEASHLRVPKRVAIKVLLATDADQLARFRQEAEVASRLGHPNIVDVLDFDTALGTPYMVMELLQGESLATRLERGRLDVEHTLTIVRQIASALQAAHEAGVIHRDLKPANVFLVPRELDGAPTDEVKVLDFGISKVQGSQVVRTNEGAVIGTPQYMAPEQAAARHDELDARTDQFALGAITYEMLAGRPAFEGENATQVMFKIVYESAPALDSLVADLPASIVRAVTRALSTRPGERFRDIRQFVEELSGRVVEAAELARMNQNTLPAGRRGDAGTRRDGPTADTRSDAATADDRRDAGAEPSATAAERPRSREERSERARDRDSDVRRVEQRRPWRRRVAIVAVALVVVGGGAAVVHVLGRTPSRDAVIAGDAASIAHVGVGSAAIARVGSDVIARSVAGSDTVAVDASSSRTGGELGGWPDAAVTPTVGPDAGVTLERNMIPGDITQALATADKEIAAGELENAESRVRRTMYTHEYPQADVRLAAIGCARHDIAQAHGWMRRAGPGSWAVIRKRCDRIGFPIADP